MAAYNWQTYTVCMYDVFGTLIHIHTHTGMYVYFRVHRLNDLDRAHFSEPGWKKINASIQILRLHKSVGTYTHGSDVRRDTVMTSNCIRAFYPCFINTTNKMAYYYYYSRFS
jgi:hypothetical protein